MAKLKRIDLALQLQIRDWASARTSVVGGPPSGGGSADELKAELQAGLRRDASDYNPLKVLRRRK